MGEDGWVEETEAGGRKAADYLPPERDWRSTSERGKVCIKKTKFFFTVVL